MTTGADIAVQRFVYRTIRAAVAPGIAVDTRPRKADGLPYVWVGQSEVREHEIGFEVLLTLEVWSEKENAVECKTLQNTARASLHMYFDSERTTTDPTWTDETARWTFRLINEEFSRAQLEQQNNVWHGTQRFRFLVQQTVLA
jgi:hypothetical protein